MMRHIIAVSGKIGWVDRGVQVKKRGGTASERLKKSNEFRGGVSKLSMPKRHGSVSPIIKMIAFLPEREEIRE